jgi:hypothetical protein
MANNQTEEEGKQFPLPHTIKLKHPIKWGQETRNELVIKRTLKAKDFKGIPAQNFLMDHMLKMLSRMTGEPQAFIEELEVEDLFAAVEVVNAFLPGGLGTGETP